MIPDHKTIELAVALVSLVILAIVMPTEEVIDDLLDRLARGELQPFVHLLIGGE